MKFLFAVTITFVCLAQFSIATFDEPTQEELDKRVYPEGRTDEMHPDDYKLDEENKRDQIDYDWDKIKATTFADPDQLHSKRVIEEHAYMHLIHEHHDEWEELMKKSDAGEALEEEDNMSLANGIVMHAYLGEIFGKRTEMSSREALKILKQKRLDAYATNMPTEIAELVVKFMPENWEKKAEEYEDL